MTAIFGDKKIFAIEYKVNNKLTMMGHSRIWINELYIGFFEEEVPLLTVQQNLNSLSKRLNELTDSSLKRNNEAKKLVEIILSLPENGKFIASLGESFDDFGFFLFKDGNVVQFLWKLYEKLFLKYPEGQHVASIKTEYFVSVVEKAQSYIQSQKLSKSN